jgi:hypothetical protein
MKEKEDEERSRFLWIFKKTILRIRDEARDNPIYLIRYSLMTTPWFAIKLHRILLSDDDCLHDHPWDFISVILWGGYVEETFSIINGYTYRHTRSRKRYGPGSFLWRPSPSPHRLIISKPATTLVITFRKKRKWGFYTPTGWKHWITYIRSGSKCE